MQAVGQLHAFVFDLESFLVGLVRVERSDEAGFAEQEVQMINLVKLTGQRIVGVDGEVGRHHGKLAARGHFLGQEVGDLATGVVVADAVANDVSLSTHFLPN